LKSIRSNFWNSAFLCGLLLHLDWVNCRSADLSIVGAGHPAHVALMNLVCEDNSYRSTQAALDFTTALQIEAGADPSHEWVERAELDKAEKELHLSEFGQTDRSEAIRSGKWVNADWAVYGRISINTPNGRSLSLEVVDLTHADELAETNLALGPQTEAIFKMASSDITLAGSALRALLKTADEAAKTAQKQTRVALFSFSPTVFNPNFAMSAGDLAQAFEASSVSGKPIHLIHFQRAGESIDEASLVLGGLAETDPDAWEKVADAYLWGTYQGGNNMRFDQQTRRFLTEPYVKIMLHVWDGKDEPRVVNLTITNDVTPAGTAQQAARAAITILDGANTEAPKAGTRQLVAQSLLQRFDEMQRRDPNIAYSLSSPDGRRAWLDAVQVLEAACFFDPGNAAAREKWLRLRWGNFTSYQTRHEFPFARRRSEAWGKYVDQFGFKSAFSNAPTPSIASEYVLSAWRPFEMFNYAQENQHDWGIPSDTGLREITAWQNQLGAEFVNRWLAAPDEPALSARMSEFFYTGLKLDDAALRSRMISKFWPQIIARARSNQMQFDGAAVPELAKHFKEIGRPGGEKELLDQLDAANQARVAPPQPPPAEEKIELPRVGELEPKNAADLFLLPAFFFSPPLTKPAVTRISFPPGTDVKGVRSMAFHEDTLWLMLTVSEPARIETQHDLVDKDFAPVLVDRTRLWRLAPGQQSPQQFGGTLATNEINGMCFRADVLWLALADGGIASLNVKTETVRRYGQAAGVNATNQYAVVEAGHGVAAIGGTVDFLLLKDGAAEWLPFQPALPHQSFSLGGDLRRLASDGNRLLYYNKQLLECDLSSHTWTNILDNATLDRIGRVDSLVGDGRGNFWLQNFNSVHQLDAVTRKIHSQWAPISPTIQNTVPPGIPEQVQRMYRKTDAQLTLTIRHMMELRQQFNDLNGQPGHSPNRFVPGSRLAGQVQSLAPDGEFLWILTRDSLLLYHPASLSYAGGFSLNGMGTPISVACNGSDLWISAEQGASFHILKLNGNSLKSVPREHWMPDTISSDELNSRLATLSPSERTLYDFFTGNDASAIRRFHDVGEKNLDAQSLYLLATAHEEMGEAGPAGHFKEELKNRFPESVFVKALKPSDRMHLNSNLKNPQHP
jgi:hypothetical protein